jgi:hypothetical protein
VFAHDRGMMHASPEWMVSGRKVDNRDLVKELLKARALVVDGTETAHKAAQAVFDYWMGYMARGALLHKPANWDGSAVLSQESWQEPVFAVAPNKECPDKFVSRVTYWTCEECEERVHQPMVGPHRFPMGLQNSADPPKRFKYWAHDFVVFNLSTLRTGEYYDEWPGHVLNTGRETRPDGTPVEFKTTFDGMQPWTEPEHSY